LAEIQFTIAVVVYDKSYKTKKIGEEKFAPLQYADANKEPS